MRIKALFTVPEGVGITEKMFGRVLLSGVCGILLCMVCLAGTTWAWFTADVENTGNEIRIAAVDADVTLTRDGAMVGETADGGYDLEAGDYTVEIQLHSEAASPVYLLMNVTQNGTARCYAIPFSGGTSTAVRQLRIDTAPADVSFSTSWIMPVAAALYEENMLPEDGSASLEIS